MSRAPTICSTPGCPTPTLRGRCTTHEREHDRARGTRTERGYGPEHQQQRAAIAARLQRGEPITCWRCGQPITNEFHLGHDDHDRTITRGPEHNLCNLQAAGRHRQNP